MQVVKRIGILLTLSIGVVGFNIQFLPQQTTAASATNWRAGNIIDDSLFYSANDMTAVEIQAFLNSKVPNCSSGYTCLKNYSQSIPGYGTDSYCGAISSGNKSAAQIIKDVSAACGIGAKVLLVLLQKEQSLVTRTNPTSNQYEKATGFACPDNVPKDQPACDAQYAGFFNQVYRAGRQYKIYRANPNGYRYKARQVNSIGYSPTSGCGASNVYIENDATAGLYIYTPYQPNQAALNNLYGEGNGCSAYGNRNFWRLYTDWFGSTSGNCTYPSSDGTRVFRLFQPNTNNYLLTDDPAEVCSATAYYGYIFDTTLAYTNTMTSPVYRLSRNGHYLYTTSSAERNSATSTYGYKYEGVAFNAATSAGAGLLPVFRLRYPPTDSVAYTVSTAERSLLVSTMGYKAEGTAFYLPNTSGDVLHDTSRLAHPVGGYLYTVSPSEKAVAVQGYGYRDEGIGFRTRAGFSADSLPVYRLAATRGYLYTTSLDERKFAISRGYRSEGVSYFAYPTSNLGASKQVFRLSHPNGTYFYTTNATERDSATRSYGYKYEGVGFRIP